MLVGALSLEVALTDASDLPGEPSCTPGDAADWVHRTFTLIEKLDEGFRKSIPLGAPSEGDVGDIWLTERPLYYRRYGRI